MNCYLKISYLTRHKKYRLGSQREVNFSQIRRQLMVNLSPQSTAFHIYKSQQLKPAQNNNQTQLIMNERQLAQYLKNLPFKEGQTIKIKIIERVMNHKKNNEHDENDSSQLNIPNYFDRQRSKSQQISMQNPAMSTKTSSIEVTQEFLYNSSFEYDEVKKVSLKQWILEDLQLNSRRKKQLQDRKRLTCIPALYKRINEAIRCD